MEFPVKTYLPYLLQTVVCMIASVLKSSITFSWLYDIVIMTVTYVTIMCDIYIFLNQQFITWGTMADHSNYFVATNIEKQTTCRNENENEN